MTAEPRKQPEHEAIYERLKAMVLFGDLAPGAPITIQGLAKALPAGMTPVREAIRRLTSEGALEALGNRRVCVPRLTPGQLDEIAFARAAIEPRLAELAAPVMTPADIARLADIDAAVDLAMVDGDITGYLRANYLFHFTFYASADAPVLLRIAQSLWLRMGPSMRVVCGRFGTSNLADQHDATLAALAGGDAAGAGRAIAADLSQGVDLIRPTLTPG